jgi:hypothetical protein
VRESDRQTDKGGNEEIEEDKEREKKRKEREGETLSYCQ